MRRKIDSNSFQTSEKRINTRPAACGHGKTALPPRVFCLFRLQGLYLSARLLRFSFRPFIRVNQAAGDVKKTMDFFRRVRPQRTNLCPCISADHTDRQHNMQPVSGLPVFPDGLNTQPKNQTRPYQAKPNQTLNCTGYGLMPGTEVQMTKKI